MNVILIIADSLTYDLANDLSFKKKCQIEYVNHWTNASWTLPSITVLATGKIPVISNPIYTAKPHCIDLHNSKNNKLWSLLDGKYYTLVSSPWIIIRELFYNLICIYGIKTIQSDSPYINCLSSNERKSKKYFHKRFTRRLGFDIKYLPRPFFHFFHYTRTHSEYGLCPDSFFQKIKKGSGHVKNAMREEMLKLDEIVNNIYENAPENTLFIFTSDHGEDFNEICKLNCGHGEVYTKDVMHVPLFMSYKTKNAPKEKKIKYLTCHKDLYNQICRWIEFESETCVNFLNPERNNFIFTQGSCLHADSIKFLSDCRVGIWDFEKDRIYTQSMVSEEEEIFNFRQKKTKGEFKLMENYRNILVKEFAFNSSEKNIKWKLEETEKNKPYDEF